MFKKWAPLGLLAAAGLAHAFAPQSGTWVVTSEVNGKPGRGLAIDVQDKTLVMQMYAYDASGNATFYLTSGAINNNQYSGTLNKYRGGRYLGSGDLTGQDNGNDGNVSMRFESGTKGYVKFPGEQEKEISRFNFAYGPNPQSLKGMWLLTPLTSTNPLSDFVELVNEIGASESGSGTVASKDNRFGCDNLVRGVNAGWVMCVKLNAANQLTRTYFFKYAVNDGEGLTGLTAATANDLLVVRRLTNSSNDGTGVVLKNAGAQEPASPAALLQAFDQAAQ